MIFDKVPWIYAYDITASVFNSDDDLLTDPNIRCDALPVKLAPNEFIAGSWSLHVVMKHRNMKLFVPGDIDVFFVGPMDERLESVRRSGSYLETMNSIHQIIDGNKIQWIKRSHKTMAEIINNFDIDCCRFIINYLGQIWFTPVSWWTVVKKINIVHPHNLCHGTPSRLRKYRKRDMCHYLINNIQKSSLGELRNPVQSFVGHVYTDTTAIYNQDFIDLILKNYLHVKDQVLDPENFMQLIKNHVDIKAWDHQRIFDHWYPRYLDVPKSRCKQNDDRITNWRELINYIPRDFLAIPDIHACFLLQFWKPLHGRAFCRWFIRRTLFHLARSYIMAFSE